MKTLKLFNAVTAKPSSEAPLVVPQMGLVIEPGALWIKDQIIDYYTRRQLTGQDLNLTFHKSWEKIKNSSRYELFIEQIRHYISTYGSDFKDEVYIPSEVLNVPNLTLVYRVIKAYTKEEIISKCLSLLQSGAALKEETVNDVLSLLIDEYKYQFTGEEVIKNKEAVIKLADIYNILPKNTMDFFRYIIFRATGQSLLIKSGKVIAGIKNTNYNPSAQFNKFGLEKLAEIFNRFKPLFLAFKHQCPTTINKIAKLSKTKHVPMVQNPLNRATSAVITYGDMHWLDNATPYALFKALSACYSRAAGQDSFVHRIRNGKSWARESVNQIISDTSQINFDFISDYLRDRFNLSGKKIFLPDNIEYSLPTSEKMFVGNIPTGTRFYGNKLAVGIYWMDEWGARDIDLSGVNISGKVGWNAFYSQGGGQLMYSGDITSAPNGAVEYLYANRGLSDPTIVKVNIYSGKEVSGYNIIVGSGDNISRDYMMNPDNLMAQVRCDSIQQQMILGFLIPVSMPHRQCFVLLNFGGGSSRVSRRGNIGRIQEKAFVQQWQKAPFFSDTVQMLGAEVVNTPEEAEYNFSMDSLEKDSFMRLFK